MKRNVNSKGPGAAELARALGKSKPLWERLLAELAAEHELAERDWAPVPQGAGWSLRLLRGKRRIVYLLPCEGTFTAAFALGDKAVAAARESGLPAHALALLDSARRYAEGTALRLEVRRVADVRLVKALVAIKLGN